MVNLPYALNFTRGTEANDMSMTLGVFKKSKVKIAQVTLISVLRPDGHLGHDGKDCAHWCLPGVPDAWSSIVYNHIMHSHLSRL